MIVPFGHGMSATEGYLWSANNISLCRGTIAGHRGGTRATRGSYQNPLAARDLLGFTHLTRSRSSLSVFELQGTEVSDIIPSESEKQTRGRAGVCQTFGSSGGWLRSQRHWLLAATAKRTADFASETLRPTCRRPSCAACDRYAHI